MFTLFLIAFTAILASAYGAMVGFGGGIFVIPVLVLVFHYPIELAVGAVTLSLVPSSLITTLLNHRHGYVDYITGIILELPTIAGVVLGSFLVALLPRTQLQYVFVIAITIVGLTFFQKKKEDMQDSYIKRFNERKPNYVKKDAAGNILFRVNYLLAAFFGLLSGGLAGLLGVGGGFIKTPIMIKVFRIPAKIASGTALFMIIMTSFSSTVSHYFLGHIKWHYALPVVAGFIIGPFIASPLKKRISSLHLEKLVGISLLLAAALMLTDILFIKK